jgi:signal transduction histidine kinase
MKIVPSRTLLALVLTAVALLLPSAAWYIAGTRELDRKNRELESSPRQQASAVLAQLTERIQDRLESLRETESRRPFYHYQNLYHDPKGASEGASIIQSPLAQSPADPLIRTYFQLDATGRLTLPTLNEDVPDPSANVDLNLQRAIRKELQGAVAASSCVNSMRASTTAQKIEVLDPEAWAQNQQASKLYADIKSRKSSAPSVLLNAGKGEVAIAVGPLQWCSFLSGTERKLAALREVVTPEGKLIQGFIIAPAAFADLANSAALPARISPEQPRVSEFAAPIEGTGWYIIVNAAKVIEAARARAENNYVGFLTLFLSGVGAASMAGLCVVALVWHTDRLARQRSQFAASAAHELRTPLAGLQMYGEMLADGLGDPTRAKDYARRLAEEAARLGRVVSNVLGFTRLERGTLKVQPEAGDIGAVVRDCVARQRPAVEAAGACIELDVPEELPVARFDRDAVAEMLQNLIDNAEKHTRSASDRRIHVSVSAADHAIEISVADHGHGIPTEEQHRLFRPFARGHEPDAPAGLGLGLVLVKALARGHGGDVQYADAPTGGAVFTLKLPVI